jgi:putative two-component system response regulator
MNINGMRILSIDDNKNSLLVIESYTQPLSLHIDSFDDAQEALLSSKNIEYDLVVVDYLMPNLNGLEFIKAFRKNNADVPIIMLTAVDDNIDLQIEALRLGANDFLTKPVNSAAFQARVQNTLKLRKAQLLLKDKAFLLEDEVKKATKLLKDNEHETLQILGKSAEYKDAETSAHTLRVAHYCKVLAKAVGLNKKIQDVIFYASPFHDLGKVGIPDKILLKPGKLDADEFEIMKTHARIGYDILKYSHSGYLKAGAVISYSHHEKYDGSGYPLGLSGERIPILGRIVAVADVFDALTSVRPYKKAWSIEDACKLLIEEKGKHFDPNLIDLFMENLDEMKSIKDKFLDEE